MPFGSDAQRRKGGMNYDRETWVFGSIHMDSINEGKKGEWFPSPPSTLIHSKEDVSLILAQRAVIISHFFIEPHAR